MFTKRDENTPIKQGDTKLNPLQAKRPLPTQATAPSTGATKRSTEATSQGRSDQGRLVVGKDITLKGEINHCDKLVVEGTIEAQLSDCQELEVLATGLYHGSADVQDAEITGQFDGELTVRRRLIIRSSARISGTVNYTEIEIERGAQINGYIKENNTDQVARAPKAPESNLTR